MTPRKAITERMKIDCLLWLSQSPDLWVRGPSSNLPSIGVRCPECGEAILPGQRIEWDHRHCLALDGPHEYQNLRPIHYDPCHKKKSARDVKALAKAKRLAGETCRGPKKAIPSRPFQKGKRPMRGKHVSG